MRCLQCGKALPLLKRLSGGEFCSEAHRKEYQREYSQLALSRLQQAMHQSSGGPRVVAAPPAPVAAATLSAKPQPEQTQITQTPTAQTQSAKPHAAPVQATTKSVPPVQAKPAQATPAQVRPAQQTAPTQLKPAQVTPAQSRRTPPVVPPPQHRAPVPAKQVAAAPAAIAGTLTRKPPAAAIPVHTMRTPSEKMVVTTIVPNLPRWEAPSVSAGLAFASAVDWDPGCEIRESSTRTAESRLELRSFAPPAPVIDLERNVIGAPDWSLAERVAKHAVDMPAPQAIAPGEAALWNAPGCGFTVSVAALGELAELQLATIDSGQPRADGRAPGEVPEVAAAPVPETLAEPRPEPQQEQPAPSSSVQPVPLAQDGSSPRKANTE